MPGDVPGTRITEERQEEMSDVELMAVIDGKPVPLNRCSWLWVSPTGCALGAVSADAASGDDEAHAHFESVKADRERQLKWGFTMELIALDDFETRARACFTDKCGHEKPTGIQTCHYCRRLGKGGFRTVPDRDGKMRVRCAAEKACRRRRIHQYGRYEDDCA